MSFWQNKLHKRYAGIDNIVTNKIFPGLGKLAKKRRKSVSFLTDKCKLFWKQRELMSTKWRLLIRVEDTGYVTIEYLLTNLLSLLFSSFFCPFVPHCFTSVVSSTRSKSQNGTFKCMFIIIVLKWLDLHLEINWMVRILKVNKLLSGHLSFPKGSHCLNRVLTVQWKCY